jgi:O-antigen/teichoic acid export membrane protein
MINIPKFILDKSSFVRVSIRFSEVFLKLILMYIILKTFGTDGMGRYTLFITSLTLFHYILGLDFYTSTHRLYNLICLNDFKKLVYNHFLYLLFIFIITLFLYLIFKNYIFSFNYFENLFFITLLFFGLLNLEIQRYFMLFNKINLFYKFSFFRSSSWIIGLIFLFAFKKLEYDLIFTLWIIGEGLSLAWGVFTIINIIDFKLHDSIRLIDFKLISNTIPKVLYLFIGTFFFKIIETNSRYVFDFFTSSDILGIFSTYLQFASVVSILVQILFFSIIYPKMLKSSSKKVLQTKYLIKIRNMLLKFSIWFLPIISIGVFVYLKFIISDKAIISNFYIFIILYFGTIFNSFFLLYNMVLFACGFDKAILKVYFFSMLFSVFTNIIFIYLFGLTGGSISFLLTNIFMYFLTKYFYNALIYNKLNFQIQSC